MHFLRNALDYVPRRVDDDCLQELRWLYDRRDLAEARRDLAAWVAKWSGKYAKLTGWVEDNIDETLTFYRLPRQHHKHLKSTNMLERLNEEIKRLWSDNLDGTAYCLTRECSPAIERCLTMFAPGASSRSARIRAPFSRLLISAACCCGPCGVVGDAPASSKRSGKSTGLWGKLR